MQGEIGRSRGIARPRQAAGKGRPIGPVTTSTAPWRRNPLSRTGPRRHSRAERLPPSRLFRFRLSGASRRRLRRTVLRRRSQLRSIVLRRRLLSLPLSRAGRSQAVILLRPKGAIRAAGQGIILPAEVATTAEARRIRAEALQAVEVVAVPAVAVVVEAAAEAAAPTVAAVAAAAITETDLRRPEPKCPPKPN